MYVVAAKQREPLLNVEQLLTLLNLLHENESLLCMCFIMIHQLPLHSPPHTTRAAQEKLIFNAP